MNKKISFLVSFLIISCARFIPFNYMVGSLNYSMAGSFFSVSTIAAVFIGKYSSWWSLLLFFVTFKKLTFSKFIYFASNRIPLLGAACSYSKPNIIISVMFPLVCMFLFIIHPVGFLAWPYATYWLIPVILFLSKKENLFSRALASVFVAHAIGSVIWIYTHDMSATTWLALIPVVAYERIVMASTITVFELCIQKVKKFFAIKKISSSKEFA
jgi:hypothetical protein